MAAELTAAEQKLLDEGDICPCSLGLLCDDCESFGHTSDCCGKDGCRVAKEHFHNGNLIAFVEDDD